MGRDNRCIAIPWCILTAVVLGLLSPAAKADPLVFTASNLTLSASVTFQQIGTNLQVTLVNSSSHDVLVKSEVLTAVFFTLAGNPTLTPLSAKLGSGSTMMFAVGGPGLNVGGEWAYRNGGLKHAPAGALQGISSVGLGTFKLPNFNGFDLQPPLRVDGLDFGITSLGDNSHTGKKAVTGRYELTQNSVVFMLALPENYTLSSISSVCFQYGKSRHDPRLIASLDVNESGVIPEPTSITLVVCGIGLLLIANRCARRSNLAKAPVRVRRSED
jgi:hypothetical protein